MNNVWCDFYIFMLLICCSLVCGCVRACVMMLTSGGEPSSALHANSVVDFFKREMYVLDMELGVVLGWVGHVQCVQLGTLWANRQTEETAKACHQYHMCQVHVPSEYFCSRHFIE